MYMTLVNVFKNTVVTLSYFHRTGSKETTFPSMPPRPLTLARPKRRADERLKPEDYRLPACNAAPSFRFEARPARCPLGVVVRGVLL